jgi:hypothetical protein
LPKGFPTKILHTFLISPICATCPAHLILLNLFLDNHVWTLWASTVIVKCVLILTAAFINLCHLQLNQFCEERESDWCRILVNMRHLLYPQSTGTSSERIDTTIMWSVLLSWPNTNFVPICTVHCSRVSIMSIVSVDNPCQYQCLLCVSEILPLLQG